MQSRRALMVLWLCLLIGAPFSVSGQTDQSSGTKTHHRSFTKENAFRHRQDYRKGGRELRV
jgi:hypothetical protein